MTILAKKEARAPPPEKTAPVAPKVAASWTKAGSSLKADSVELRRMLNSTCARPYLRDLTKIAKQAARKQTTGEDYVPRTGVMNDGFEVSLGQAAFEIVSKKKPALLSALNCICEGINIKHFIISKRADREVVMMLWLSDQSKPLSKDFLNNLYKFEKAVR